MKTIKNQLKTILLSSCFLLLTIGSVFSQTPDCTSSVLQLSGPLFASNAAPLCPAPTCTSFSWQVDLMELENSTQVFSKIVFEIENSQGNPAGNVCPGSLFTSFAPMGNSSAQFDENATFKATIFVHPPNDVTMEMEFCEREIDFEVINYNDIVEPIDGTTELSEVIGAHLIQVGVNNISSNIFNTSDIFWLTENETDGSFTILNVVNTANGSTADVMLDDFSEGDIVAFVMDKCGTVLELHRFIIKRFCPEIRIDGPSECPTWCGDPNETFTYSVSTSPTTTLNLNFDVAFSALNVISVSPNVVQNPSVSNPRLTATGDFSFELQPVTVNNSNHQILVSYSIGQGTASVCDEAQVSNIYSGLINGIDLSLNVHPSSPGVSTGQIPVGPGGNEGPRGPRDSSSPSLCLNTSNYIEAAYYGEGDACLLDWDWQVPAGWTVQFPDFPDKSIGLVIPNSSYGDIYIRARNECGWSNWISYGFSVRSCGWFKFEEELDGINFYPNPIQTGSSLNIDLTPSEKQSIVSIYSIKGKMIQSTIIEAYERYHSMSLTEFKPGIYWIKVQSAEKSYTEKLIISN